VPFRIVTALGDVFVADTLEECKNHILAGPEEFAPGQRVMVRGPSVADPAVDDEFPFTPPIPRTPSEMFRAELLAAMPRPERGRVTSWPEERELAPGQTAAVWFTNNRQEAGRGRSLYVVRTGPELRDIGFIHNLAASAAGQVLMSCMPSNFITLEGVAGFVLGCLFDDV
jgi:hypothetical protein